MADPLYMIAEDGTGKTDANAYGPLTYLASYHSARGHEAWESLDEDAQAHCAIRATDYIEKRFGRKFRGIKASREQSLAWPRFDVWDDDERYLLVNSDELPADLLKAWSEYSLRAALYSELAPDPLRQVPDQDFTGDDLPDVATTQGTGAVVSKREKVDVVEEETEFSKSGYSATSGKTITNAIVASGNIPEYPAADLYLEGLLRSTAGRRLARG